MTWLAATQPAGLGDLISPYMGVFFVAFGFSFVLTPLMRKLAVDYGVVDWPDAQRKNHGQPIAYLGGVAIFLGWLGGVFLCYFMAPATPGLEGNAYVGFPLPIIVGAAVITLTGFLDDVFHISPRIKLGGQLVAAAALAWNPAVSTRLVLDTFEAVGVVGVPHTLAYTLGAVMLGVFVIGGCNSLNLLDGADGLASGVTGIAALGFLALSAIIGVAFFEPGKVAFQDMLHHQTRIVLCLALLGAVLGFLPYNFNPANIFMGDAGSLLLGYLSVTAIMHFALVPRSGPLLVMAALIIFALPITDTTLAIVRRKMAGQPIFCADSNHLHHQLIRTGMGVKRAVLCLYAIAAFFALLGCSLAFLQWRYVIAFFVVLFGFIVVTAYKAGQRHVAAARAAAGEKPAPRLEAAPAATPEIAKAQGSG